MNENLPLPPIAALGFFEVLILMFVMVWFAGRCLPNTPLFVTLLLHLRYFHGKI